MESRTQCPRPSTSPSKVEVKAKDMTPEAKAKDVTFVVKARIEDLILE
jgi:hypothetical protein